MTDLREDDIVELEPPERLVLLRRVAYPSAVWYQIGGYLSLLPPATHETVYRTKVRDLAAHDRLVQTGALNREDHTGRKNHEVIDNRRAPGG